MSTLGSRLRQAMEAKGLTPMDLVHREVMSKAGIYLWLNDTVKPDKVRDDTVKKLCKALDVDRDWLIDGKGSPRVGGRKQPGPPLSPADEIRSLKQDVHAIRLALSAMAAVMVSHRPAEAADLVSALGKLPEEYSRQGLARHLSEALSAAVDPRGKARSS